jgi:AraC-like DNA-binding protein
MEATQPTLAFLPVHPYARLLDVLAERAHARGTVLAAAGLDVEAFARHGGYLSLQQMEALVTCACACEPDRDLGLEVGARVSLMSHGALGVAVLSAATIGEAIAVLAKHFALVSPLFEANVRVEDDIVVVALRGRYPLSAALERYHAAFCASLFAHIPGLLAPGSQSSEPELDLARLELRIPTTLAARALPLADAYAHGDALRRCRASLDARPDPTDAAATVRRVLVASGAPFPDLDRIAKRLATSGRSLRRRLREEGTSFRSLLDEVRSSLADAWLEDPRRSITEIGLDLGYTDAANFARAYRRANGVSPSTARRQRLGLAASM